MIRRYDLHKRNARSLCFLQIELISPGVHLLFLFHFQLLLVEQILNRHKPSQHNNILYWEAGRYRFLKHPYQLYLTQDLISDRKFQPIKYRADSGKSIWVQKEVADMMIAWDMAVAKGAWVTVSDEIIEEVKEKTGLEFKKQHQGVDNFGKYFEEEHEIGKYMFKKFREALKK